MEYNLPSELVKDLSFGDDAKAKVITGVNKLAQAVKSTLGASGKCVIYEDGRGKPVITTATVLAEALIKQIDTAVADGLTIREIKDGVNETLDSVISYLNTIATDVEGGMLKSVSAISCNNDKELGAIIAEAYDKVGKQGVVLMEESESDETYVDVVDGVKVECGITSPHFVTNTEKQTCELDNPLVFICSSEIPNVRKIQSILEYVIKNNRSLLIVAPVAQQVKSALISK
jgi:chaperonin GroEL